MAWQGFCRGDLKQKLLGAGPDCFAGYLEQVLPGGTVLFDKGYFAGSIFTNAHNEWLTTLINLGVLGTAAYAAYFLPHCGNTAEIPWRSCCFLLMECIP